ncbi:hypothetical protein Patl1_27222 [Pistacia atlantica]|uniref:Uncharacterized protein n=1 Tax=Pistacia atlantica TaxID=434234 RepID=A0ACC1BF17_9ROSI|nr:hypothetical protein Patl1_27222 [Pistacia atlantica]
MHESTCVEEPQIVYTSSLLRSTKKLHSMTYDEANNVMKKSEIPVLEFSGDNREKNTYELCYVEYGLLCIRKYRQHELVFLLNPLTGEVLELPRSTSELWKINWCKTSWYGMGFDCTTNTYKIVRVMEISHAEFDTEVHTLGTNSWRRIGSNPSCILSNCGVNAYGDMHWLRSNLKQRIEYETMIRSFDFKREEFKWIRYPNLKHFAHKSCIKVPLINLRGSLAIVNVLPYNEMEIWVMKDYDKKEYYWIEFTILMEITNCPSTSRKNKQQFYGNFPTHIVVDIFLRSACVEEPQILCGPPYLQLVKKYHSIPYDEANYAIKKSEIPILEFSEKREKDYKLCCDKVVRVLSIRNTQFETQVYTLGTNSWRQISSNPSCILSSCGVTAYEDMHWMPFFIGGNQYEMMIVSFNFKEEEFKWTRHPKLEYSADLHKNIH